MYFQAVRDTSFLIKLGEKIFGYELWPYALGLFFRGRGAFFNGLSLQRSILKKCFLTKLNIYFFLLRL